MYIALDEKNNRVSANNANCECSFICPMCKRKVLLCRGEIKTPYFRHQSLDDCDSWYDYKNIGEWHLRHQEQFPEECREVIIEYNGEIHRADVCINFTNEEAQQWIDDYKEYMIDYNERKSKGGVILCNSDGRVLSTTISDLPVEIAKRKGVIFEFQHSPLSPSEFMKRSTFYRNAGYLVYWIFDMQQKECLKTWYYDAPAIVWKHRSHTFDYYNFRQFAQHPNSGDWRACAVDVTVVFEMEVGWAPKSFVFDAEDRYMICKEFGAGKSREYIVTSAYNRISSCIQVGGYVIY